MLKFLSVKGLGDGAGGFTGTTTVPVGTSPYISEIGDFNGDGKQDFASSNIGANNVSIKLGDGLGGFSGSTIIAAGSSPYRCIIGDYNGDGYQDLAIVSR